MEKLEEAILLNQLEQKKQKKDTYTKPHLFVKIEKFIRDKRLIGYGGTAINHALPNEVKFYKEDDIPDYDFFSTRAKEDIVELADLLYSEFKTIEVKPSMFQGTYKLFVNYLPLVDMTQIEEDLFKNLRTESFTRNGIHYVPYNYLRMSMHQELSRPLGDLTRWTKVYQRLELLNKHHPFLVRKCDIHPTLHVPQTLVKSVALKLKDYVMFGDYSIYFWQDLFPKKYQDTQQDVLFILSETIDEIWAKLKGLNVKFTFYQNKLIHVYEIYIENYPMLYVVLSDSCMNYNIYKKHKLATYDTCLSLYYALSFVNIKHQTKKKLLSYCYLFSQIKDLSHPLMTRFKLPCYGKQITLQELRKEREMEYKERKGKKTNYFQYRPSKKLMTRKIMKKG
jgi:hypothetical protein